MSFIVHGLKLLLLCCCFLPVFARADSIQEPVMIKALDKNGFEIIVKYNYEFEPSFFVEGHGLRDIGNFTVIELNSVILSINGHQTQILHLLTEEEKSFIIKKQSNS